MAFVLEDRVVETANNPGQGDFELLGATDNNRSFVTGIGNGNTTRYLAIGAEGWEIGIGTVSAGSPDRLLRPGSVTKNSNGNTTPIDFGGIVILACIVSVEDVAWIDDGGILQVPGGLTTGSSIVSGGNIQVKGNNIYIQSDSNKHLRFLDSTGTVLGVLALIQSDGRLILRVNDANGETAHQLELDRNGRATFTGTIYGNGAGLTNLNASNISSGTFSGNGSGLTNLNGSNISSGTVAAARIDNLPASKITSGTFHLNRIPTIPNDKLSDPWPGVYTGSSNGATNLPVGSVVVCYAEGNRPARNASVTVRLGSSSQTYNLGGSGTALSGTWRSSGLLTGHDHGAVRRTA